jgi:hypothetical protein
VIARFMAALLAFGSFAIASSIMAIAGADRAVVESSGPFCPSCGYEMASVPDAQHRPECGRTVPEAPRQHL